MRNVAPEETQRNSWRAAEGHLQQRIASTLTAARRSISGFPRPPWVALRAKVHKKNLSRLRRIDDASAVPTRLADGLGTIVADFSITAGHTLKVRGSILAKEACHAKWSSRIHHGLLHRIKVLDHGSPPSLARISTEAAGADSSSGRVEAITDLEPTWLLRYSIFVTAHLFEIEFEFHA